jgi:hypothetical protein
MMDWSEQLLREESILWQGRPAPRCYTFRNWGLASLGLVLFLLSSFWQMLGMQLVEDGHPWYLALLPVPLVIGSFLLGPGQILWARFAWERLFYCLTERRLLIRSGVWQVKVRQISLEEIESWQQRRHGEHLASIRLVQSRGKYIILHCVEQPQYLIAHLEQAIP